MAAEYRVRGLLRNAHLQTVLPNFPPWRAASGSARSPSWSSAPVTSMARSCLGSTPTAPSVRAWAR